ncbi:hypothetical protein EXS74_03090 [Candidatus Woesearchaeota archaeon]|nr:hypothetical protein [Candidatus Woesearchaeota archaeon]
MYKRGQLTLLIILGLLVVSSVGLVYYYKDQIFLSEWERERTQSLLIPTEAEELHDQIGNCVSSLASAGITLLGQQGGYITLPEDPIGQGSQNPFSNSLEIFAASDFKTVYWFYQAANGVDHSQVPTISDMEYDLSQFMNNNLATCANDFDLFTRYNATAAEISTEVEILDDTVLFTVNYPVHIAQDDFTFDFDAFYVSQDVPLGSLYQAATEIMDTENEEFVFEDLSYDSLVLYPDQVPLSWAEFDCEQKSWDVTEVENNLKSILSENILAVKVRGTKYDVNTESDTNYFEWDLIESSVPEETSVNIFYSTNWPFSMQVYPTQGSTLQEDTLTGSPATAFLSGLFCLNTYSFIYDIKYPVLITLYDEDSDFRFQFASMVILDNNQARENTQGLLDLNPVETTICSDTQSELTVNVVEVAEDGSLVDLSGAEVSFQCINNLCPLGSTRSYDSVFAVPPCVNGQVIAEKEGYQDGMSIVTTTEDASTTVVLEKYYNLSYDIQIVDAEGNVRDPTSDDVLFVTLTEEETGYTTTLSYPYQGESVLLIPGTYTVDGKLISDVPFDISIDPSSYTKCTSVPQISLGGLFGLGDDTSCTDVEISEVDLQSVLTGGVEHSWDADRYELQDASHITFYVTSPGMPESAEDLEDVYTYIDSGLGYREPEFT